MTTVTRRVHPHAQTNDNGQTWEFTVFSVEDMTQYGYCKLDSVDVTFEVPSDELLRGKTVEALRATLQRVRAEAQAQALELEVQISKLLCLTYKSDAP